MPTPFVSLISSLALLPWELRTTDPREGFLARVRLGEVDCHLIAIPVEVRADTQVALAHSNDGEFDRLGAEYDGAFQTARVKNFDCVLTLVPFAA